MFWQSLLSAIVFLGMITYGSIVTRANETRALSNAKQIGTACMIYAMDKNGAFPATLDELVPDYLSDRSVFISALSGPSTPVGYEYYGGRNTDPPDKIILVSKARGKDGQRVVIHVNGTGAMEKFTPDFERALLHTK